MRINRLKYLAFLPQCLAIFMLAGCIATSDEPSMASVKQSANDSKGGNPQEKGGWDDFPNKYKPMLLDLSANARQIPVPLGTRYETIYSINETVLNKSAADGYGNGCAGDSTVFKYQRPQNDFFLYDTTTFYDSNGVANCAAQGGSRASERHVRRIVELGVGEAWETIQDSITDQDILPRHTLHGTGFFRLESGLEFTIRSYDMTLLTQFGTLDAFVVDANLELLYKEAYTIRLGLAKPHPFKAVDFFPMNGPVQRDLIMTGPITHASANGGVDTLGFIDLYDDHILQVRDWAGERIAP
jgi:hypothetical protein